jgi:DNA-directed RNA polymerase specialized sigma24 family protein
MITITASAVRSGDWWAVSFDGPTGTFHTQARRLDLVGEMVRDILDMEGIGEAFINVVPVVSAEDEEAARATRAAAAEAARVADEASTRSRQTVARLRAEGLTVRDIGTLLGVSPQRVSQLAS